MNRAVLILFFIIYTAGIVNAGFPEVLIEKNFDSRNLTELIRYTEAGHKIRFFYIKEWTDSIRVIQESVPANLEVILKQSLMGTEISYFAHNPENIVLSYRYEIVRDMHASILQETEETPHEISNFDRFSFIEKKPETGLTGEEPEGGVLSIGVSGDLTRASEAVISGFVREKETGLSIPYAVVYVNNLNKGTVTDDYGYYVLSVPPGRHEIMFKFLGYKDETFDVIVSGSGTVDAFLEEQLIELRGVVITAEREQNVRGLQLGLDKLDIGTIRNIPSNLGEADIIKSTLLLPGVQTVGEGASGFNVRGGNTDQNLILLDGAPIFNSSHMFGFFSVFNPEIVKDFRLYKSGIPAKYGGRLSSVLDVSTKDGNLKDLTVSGGISPIAARLTIDGPVIKDKATFLFSGRGGHSGFILHNINVPELKNSLASFFDLNSKLTYKTDKNNEFKISAYYSENHFKLNYDTLYNHRNISGTIGYKHSFSSKIYGLFTGIFTNYSYSLNSEADKNYSFDLKHLIEHREARTDFTWFLNSKHTFNFGANVINYRIDPGTLKPAGQESLIVEQNVPGEQAFEAGLYLSDEIVISNNLSMNLGLRYSSYFSVGPGKVYSYLPDSPRSLISRTDSTAYLNNEISQYYGGPEIRFSARYITGPSSSVKISFTRMNQYLHMLSNTTAISPTDIWKTSGPNLPPQKSWQYSAGFYKDLMNNTIEASLEVYLKNSEDVLEYRNGTNLFVNPDLEIDLLQGVGKAYGMEMLFRKKFGALNGWASYTWSRSLNKVDDEHLVNRINRGEYFPANYDKPHDLTIVANYRFSRRISLASTVTYSTGRPITYPVGKYQFRGRELIHYSERNEYRIPNYFRWDASVNFGESLKSQKRVRSTVSISAYNLTGRNNAYSIFFVSDSRRKVQGYKLSVFNQPVISATWNFRF